MKIVGTTGRDILEGEATSDTILGRRGGDVLIGLDGDDALRGGRGNDDILGGDGFDKLWGGKGDDTFWFSTTPQEGRPDKIKDFVPGEDNIEVRAPRFTDPGDLSLSYDAGSGKVTLHNDGDSHVIAKMTKGLDVGNDDLVIT